MGIWLGEPWWEIVSRLWLFYSEDRERDWSTVLGRILGIVTVRMRAKKEAVENCVQYLVILLILEFKSSVSAIKFKWQYFLCWKYHLLGVILSIIHLIKVIQVWGRKLRSQFSYALLTPTMRKMLQNNFFDIRHR